MALTIKQDIIKQTLYCSVHTRFHSVTAEFSISKLGQEKLEELEQSTCISHQWCRQSSFRYLFFKVPSYTLPFHALKGRNMTVLLERIATCLWKRKGGFHLLFEGGSMILAGLPPSPAWSNCLRSSGRPNVRSDQNSNNQVGMSKWLSPAKIIHFMFDIWSKKTSSANENIS